MSEEARVLEYRVSTLEGAIGDIRRAVASIDQSLQAIVRLDAQYQESRETMGRAFSEIEDHETRIKDVEKEMPSLTMVRGWLITGVTGILGLCGLALAKLIVLF